MSVMPEGVTYSDTDVKVKVLKNTSAAPQSWYRALVGQTLNVTKRIWRKDGQVTQINYIMERTPGGGYDGSFMPGDVEEDTQDE